MNKIPVTKPFLPPRVDFDAYIDQIWESQWLTNMGPLSKKLEERLTEHLEVDHLLYVTNGTVALQMAIKALALQGEVITTPFSFVSTTSSIVWEGCTPVFVDIDPDSCNIDPNRIEAAITPKTTAILATHVYGNPCDVAAIETIAQKYRLKVIYDGAHAFGVKVNGKSIYKYGDISICSLHATKLYHSGEGGLVITTDQAIYKKLKSIRNFGIAGHDKFDALGINGKNSEFHAAMGLANFPYIKTIHHQRKVLTEAYDKRLKNVSHRTPQWHPQATHNYAYYPVIFKSEAQLLAIKERLAQEDIQVRRYFYPSLAQALPYIQHQEMEVTESIAERVLCLPLYYDLTVNDVELICSVVIQ